MLDSNGILSVWRRSWMKHLDETAVFELHASDWGPGYLRVEVYCSGAYCGELFLRKWMYKALRRLVCRAG